MGNRKRSIWVSRIRKIQHKCEQQTGRNVRRWATERKGSVQVSNRQENTVLYIGEQQKGEMYREEQLAGRDISEQRQEEMYNIVYR